MTSSFKSATLCSKNQQKDAQCWAGSMSEEQRCPGNRESGARPERSGPCERGERLQNPLYQTHEKAQLLADPRVRKPAEQSGAQLPRKAGRQREPPNDFVCVCPASAFLKGRHIFCGGVCMDRLSHQRIMRQCWGETRGKYLGGHRARRAPDDCGKPAYDGGDLRRRADDVKEE